MQISSRLKSSTSLNSLAIARSLRFRESFVLSSALLALASCGGGGGGGSASSGQPTVDSSITGTVIKGPLQNALVFAENNNDFGRFSKFMTPLTRSVFVAHQ